MNWISNNNDVEDFRDSDSLIYTTLDGKKFGFRRDNTNSIIKSSFDWNGIWVDICDGSGNIISDACIRNNYD